MLVVLVLNQGNHTYTKASASPEIDDLDVNYDIVVELDTDVGIICGEDAYVHVPR